jgi:WD40 repeat protein
VPLQIPDSSHSSPQTQNLSSPQSQNSSKLVSIVQINTLHSIASQLPINSVLELVDDFPAYSNAFQNPICCFALTRDETYILTVSNDGHMRQWEIYTKRLFYDYGLIHSEHVWWIALTPCDRWAFTVCSDGTMKQWDIPEKCLWYDWGQIHQSWVECCAISPCGGFVYTGSGAGLLKKWGVEGKALEKGNFWFFLKEIRFWEGAS